MRITLTDLLPALKGEGSLRVDHRFVIYRLHFYHFIASGFYPTCSISGKLMDGSSTHYSYPSMGVALTSRSKGLGGYVFNV